MDLLEGQVDVLLQLEVLLVDDYLVLQEEEGYFVQVGLLVVLLLEDLVVVRLEINFSIKKKLLL